MRRLRGVVRRQRVMAIGRRRKIGKENRSADTISYISNTRSHPHQAARDDQKKQVWSDKRDR